MIYDNLLAIIESQQKEIDELKSKGVEIMPCNQGRNCSCGNSKSNRSTVIVTSLLFVAIVSMAYGVYTLLHGTKGQQCEITLQFKDSKATYVGRTV